MEDYAVEFEKVSAGSDYKTAMCGGFKDVVSYLASCCTCEVKKCEGLDPRASADGSRTDVQIKVSYEFLATAAAVASYEK